jgi:hypothetical protein
MARADRPAAHAVPITEAASRREARAGTRRNRDPASALFGHDAADPEVSAARR